MKTIIIFCLLLPGVHCLFILRNLGERGLTIYPPKPWRRRTAHCLLLIAICLLANDTHAQTPTWNEFFKQNKTQKKYLVDQIAALKVHLVNLKEGYQIVQRGLYTLDNIKSGNVNLHRDFFSSLTNVNPHIKNSAKVADIVAYQIYIIRDFKQSNDRLKREGNLTAEELYYLGYCYTNMMKSCELTLMELIDTITKDKRQLTDDQRILEIDRLHADMRDKYAFVRAFGKDNLSLSAMRGKERRDAEWRKTL